MSSITSQKITMLIQVFPRPRLDIVSECREAIHGGIDAGGPVDDFLVDKAVDDTGLNVKIQRRCFAFNIAPEDLFLLTSQEIEALLSGTRGKVTKTYACEYRDDSGNDPDRYGSDQDNEIQFTFLPVLQDPKRSKKRIRSKEKGGENGAATYKHADWYFQKIQNLRKRLHL